MSAQSIICPNCHASDQVQKVTAVVSSNAGLLRQRLAAPIVPQEPKFKPSPFPYESFVAWANKEFLTDLPPTWKRMRSLTRGASVGLGFTIISIIPTLILWIADLTQNKNTEAQMAGQILLLFLVLGFVCGSAIWISYPRFIRHAKETYAILKKNFETNQDIRRKQFYETEHLVWKIQQERINRLVTLWSKELYYCHRDDVVFLPHSLGVSPDEMTNLLAQNS